MTGKLYMLLMVLSIGCLAQGTDFEMVMSLARQFGLHHILLVKDQDAFKQVDVFLNRLQLLLTSGNKILVVFDSDNFFSLKSLVEAISSGMTLGSDNLHFSAITWSVFTRFKMEDRDFLENVRIPFDRRIILVEGNNKSGRGDYSIKGIIYGSTENVFDMLPVSGKRLASRWNHVGGQTIKISTVGKDACKLPYDIRGIKGVVQCIHFRLWSLVARKLNLSVIYSRDPPYEIPFSDRVKFYGVELSFQNLVLSSSLLCNFSFLWPTWKQRLDVYTAYLDQALEWKTFIKPFQAEIWVCVAGSVGILTAVALILERLLPLSEAQIFDLTLLPLMAFCNQGIPETPKNFNRRLLFILSFAVPMILVPAYSAVLTSFLTVHVLRMPFSDLDGLATAKHYKLGNVPPFDISFFLKKSYMSDPYMKKPSIEYFFFQQDPSQTAQKLLKKKLCPLSEMPKTEKEGAERMCREKFSFVNVYVSMITIKPPCRYYKFDKPFLVIHAGMPIRKKSPYKPFIDRCLREIHYSGLLEAIKEREAGYMMKMKEMPQEDEKESPVTFQNTVLLFILVLSGVTASLLVLYLEIRIKQRTFVAFKIKNFFYNKKNNCI